MMRVRRHLVAAIAVLCLSHTAALAGAKPSMLPAELNDPTLNVLRELEEQPMWPKAPGKAVTRYRLSLIGINCRLHTIRFDESPDGDVRGQAKVWDRCRHDNYYDAQDFHLPRVRFALIKAAMVKAGLWQRPASYWAAQDPDSICLDGTDVIFERRDAQDFRMDQANVWCSTTRDYVIAARMLLIAADDRAGLALLPEIENAR